ncbi:hypothetical protein BDZ91DRAFT_733803 [Kalaharituber pfeilii]|nr:hypothetical protein BDZ91DRAFT_733803 [Kalaharituber pfeilii]
MPLPRPLGQGSAHYPTAPTAPTHTTISYPTAQQAYIRLHRSTILLRTTVMIIRSFLPPVRRRSTQCEEAPLLCYSHVRPSL